jgi:acetyltransferase-like isoleucine patch superfamily enzyme
MFEMIANIFRVCGESLYSMMCRVRFGVGAIPWTVRIATNVRLQITDGGVLSVGAGSFVDAGVRLTVKRGKLSIGLRSHIGTGAIIVARNSIDIGNDVLMGEYVTIRDQDHRIDPGVRFSMSGFAESPIVIGNNVWLGSKVTVLRGVKIGSNVVVGANSVVTHDLPDNCVAVGAPARVVRHLDAG